MKEHGLPSAERCSHDGLAQPTLVRGGRAGRIKALTGPFEGR